MYYRGCYGKNIPMTTKRIEDVSERSPSSARTQVTNKSVKSKNTKICNLQTVPDETIRLPSTNTRVSGSFKAFPAWQEKNDHSKEPWI
jgi:hypothetical protein